ncbi:MAG TPA: FAD-dependent oxidoreductase [Caulobacteraceae bacterium]
MSRLHVLIAGAGIVGLSVAYHLRQGGADVTVVDRDLEGDKASFGNAGGIAVTEVVPASAPGVAWRVPGWMADPLGPVSVRPAHAPRLLPWLIGFARAGAPRAVDRISAALAALNTRADQDLVALLQDIGLPGELNRSGALTLYETAEGFARDAWEWRLKRAAGWEAQDIPGAEARALEPDIGANVRCAVLTPQWSTLKDPERLALALGAWLRRAGVVFRSGEVAGVEVAGLRLAGGETLTADRVVVAAGAWSGALARSAGDPVLIESERGYTATLASPGVRLTRELIFAERKFVAAPLDCGLRIGGAAEFGGLDAKPNFKRSQALLALAARYLPGLRSDGAVYWAGHRPTTPDSLPVIGSSPRDPRILYAFGHGHLGLTQAATTGRLIADLVFARPPAMDMSPFSIARFARGGHALAS